LGTSIPECARSIKEEAPVQKTRRQILDILKRRRTATLEELAREIGLSAVTIRAHISVLERDDLVSSEEVRGKIGRPHFVYTLTEGAEGHFPATYDAVAHRFMDGFRAVASPEQMGRLVDLVAQQWARERAPRLLGKPLLERVNETVRIRNEEGAMAQLEAHNGTFTIRQHNCPALRIARQHPEVCLAELEYLRHLLGARVERETSISGGDDCCSYRVSGQD
jgi:predicted ArsR family transcriptional regulator